jgi:glucose/arabinose dehydrogenase
MTYSGVLAAGVLAVLLGACSDDAADLYQYGPNPELPEPSRGLLPNMTIAGQAPWGDQQPIVPAGYTISAIATDLRIPRQTLILPNGDILVAEGRGGNAPALKPKDIVAGYIKSKGGTSVESGDRLTLLRDADGDVIYEMQTVFADNLNAPYGLALVGNALYVANQDALLPVKENLLRIAKGLVDGSVIVVLLVLVSATLCPNFSASLKTERMLMGLG